MNSLYVRKEQNRHGGWMKHCSMLKIPLDSPVTVEKNKSERFRYLLTLDGRPMGSLSWDMTLFDEIPPLEGKRLEDYL